LGREAATSFIGDIIGEVVGGITGTKAAAQGASKAAATQANAFEAGIAEQRRQFDTTRTDLKPWQAAGEAALAQQMALVGLNGTASQQEAINVLRQSPQFLSLLTQGEEGILQNASATGGLRGGNLQNSLSRFRSDLLSSVITDQYGKLGGLSGTGAETGTNLGMMGANSASAIAQLLGQKGSAIAGGQIAKGNANQNAFNSAMQIAGVVAGF
jgi:hypothetical protein